MQCSNYQRCQSTCIMSNRTKESGKTRETKEKKRREKRFSQLCTNNIEQYKVAISLWIIWLTVNIQLDVESICRFFRAVRQNVLSKKSARCHSILLPFEAIQSHSIHFIDLFETKRTIVMSKKNVCNAILTVEMVCEPNNSFRKRQRKYLKRKYALEWKTIHFQLAAKLQLICVYLLLFVLFFWCYSKHWVFYSHIKLHPWH